MSEAKSRRLAHGHWFKLSSDGHAIFRILRFSPNLEGGPAQGAGELVIDWPAWLDLYGRAEDVDAPLQIEISKARWWHLPRLAVSHPDPTVRLSGALGFISLVLGVLSFVLALM